MKKCIKIIALASALCIMLSAGAFAAEFEHCADAMKSLDLFKGTATGYELDRAPTRAEAAAMLVRLLGAEEEALALSYTAPYADVADWAKPYVQYLYDKGLTKGTGEKTFGYSDKCSAKQYATFLLRALGYSDGADGDFSYDGALNFAFEKGLADQFNCNEVNFLRDHVAAMSYTALATAPKSGEVDLLSKLVAEGAVQDKKGLRDSFAAFRGFVFATKELENAEKSSMNAVINAEIMENGTLAMNLIQSVRCSLDINFSNPDKSKMSFCGSSEQKNENGENGSVDVNYYYTDGYIYTEAGGEKVKQAMSFSEAAVLTGASELGKRSIPISGIKKITAEKASDLKTITYTAEYAVASPSDVDSGVWVDSLKETVRVRDGKLIMVNAETVMKNRIEGAEIQMKLDVKMSDIKCGNAVEVAFPIDLIAYTEKQ